MSRQKKTVALLGCDSTDYLRGLASAIEHAGAAVTVTSEPATAIAADGLILAAQCGFAGCLENLRSFQGDRILGQRLAGGRPVWAIGTGMQALFDAAVDPDGSLVARGCGEWPGTVEELHSSSAAPAGAGAGAGAGTGSGPGQHTGWNTIDVPAFSGGGRNKSKLFAGIDPDREFFFDHTSAVRRWELEPDVLIPPIVGYTKHGEDRFVVAVENGPLWATQFFPEKSDVAGKRVIGNWVRSL
ncbi:imidazole glycerol phosphate synthase [Corynebacterium massiliense]|uniref:Imidazole glycerol phosphate synthase subunit HisH n=1 Tax=Corynebacterium massiliense DSM 45435 TaxID=1121364 RepID=A0ABY7U7Y0_9CORY|nr:imidazole glycerol phosphate synthase [Corynebacterium massiliense]WCZ32810.1 Imidazole glycerol phosphate synthase subunit HisH [Corynebacterium massiliense DSM 45435]